MTDDDKMTDAHFERLNALADKALNAELTDLELKEFNQLLTTWNISTELNLFSSHQSL